MGDTWVHLREYLVCGHVGCCDSTASLPRRNTPTLAFGAVLSPTGVIRALKVVGAQNNRGGTPAWRRTARTSTRSTT